MAISTMIEFANFKNEVRYLLDEKKRVLVTLGPKSYIVEAFIEASEKCNVLVGNYCSIAHKVNFLVGMNHNTEMVTTYPNGLIGCIEIKNIEEEKETLSSRGRNVNSYEVSIGHDVWIGRGATILSGVKIGNGAVIGAQAVVAKDVPPYAIVVGNPGRIVKYRFDEGVIKKLQAIKWWYWPEEKIVKNKKILGDPKKFVDKFYISGMESEIINETTKFLKKLRAEGIKIYYFIPDFNSAQYIWKEVIQQYLHRYTAKDKVALILEIRDGFTDNVNSIYKWLGQLNTNAPMVISNNSNGELPVDVLKNIDVFITTQDYESVQCIDYVSDYGGSVRSGFDDIIFE